MQSAEALELLQNHLAETIRTQVSEASLKAELLQLLAE